MVKKEKKPRKTWEIKKPTLTYYWENSDEEDMPSNSRFYKIHTPKDPQKHWQDS